MNSTTSCSTIIHKGDFIVDMIDQNLTQTNNLQKFMNKNSLHLHFNEATTIHNSQVDNIWTNAPNQQCIAKTVEAYLSNDKPIYFAFKCLDYDSHKFNNLPSIRKLCFLGQR